MTEDNYLSEQYVNFIISILNKLKTFRKNLISAEILTDFSEVRISCFLLCFLQIFRFFNFKGKLIEG